MKLTAFKFSWLLGLALLLSFGKANATVLWAGGEDVDFPNGSSLCISTTAGNFRAGYAREAINVCGIYTQVAQSPAFSGGTVTSAWISFRVFNNVCCGGQPSIYAGLGTLGTPNLLVLGTDTTSFNKVALWKYNGSWTKLATEAGVSLTPGALNRLDMQVINYGAAATVNVYINGSASLLFSYSGDVTANGSTSVNSVALIGSSLQGTPLTPISEIIVSSTDTRALSLATLVPNAAGDLNQWTGAYTNINPTTINDANNTFDNNSGDTFECKLNTLPAGSFSVQAVKIAARSTAGPGGMTSLSVGVKTNGSVNAPSAVTLGGSWATSETLYQSNPITSTGWTTGDLNALQINFSSAP